MLPRALNLYRYALVGTGLVLILAVGLVRAFHGLLLVEPLIIGCRSDRFLIHTQYDCQVIVGIASNLEVLERHREVLLAEAEETSPANQHRNHLAVAVGNEVVDVAYD